MVAISFVSKYAGSLLKGLEITVIITGISIVGGLSLGTGIAILRLSKFSILRSIVTAYVEFFRCTPALVQLVWVYFCLPIIFGREVSAFTAAVLALSLNAAAFYGENIRAGIQAVPREQIDVAQALGFSRIQVLRYVVLPQALRIVIPSLLTNSLGLFMQSSLVSTIAVPDLMYQGRLLSTVLYRPLEILSTVALIYFFITLPISIFVRRIEFRLGLKIERG